MLDDLLESLLESMDIPLGGKRGQTIARIFFGLLGGFLGAAGVWKMLCDQPGGLPLRLTFAALFAFLAAFCLGNVALHRQWKWTWRGFLACLIGVFVVRIMFGA